MNFSPRRLARTGIAAATYALLTPLPPLASIGYGPVQVRVSEALTVLPFISGDYVWGLFLGCILANLGSPFFAYDVTLGSFTTLLAALITARVTRPWLAPLPPVVLNALIVSWYVGFLTGVPYLITAGYIFLGQVVACFGPGYPMLLYVLRNPTLKNYLSQAS